MTDDEIERDLRTAVDERLAARLEQARRQRTASQARAAEHQRRRAAGLQARHRAKLARTQAATNPGEPDPPHVTNPPTTCGGPVDTDADLRRAIADLTDRERAALRQQTENAAGRWSGTMPRIGAVWAAFAAVVAEIDRAERARTAAHEATKDQLHPGL